MSIHKLKRFVKEHTNDIGLVEIHKNVCRLLDNNKIFSDDIDETLNIIKQKCSDI